MTSRMDGSTRFFGLLTFNSGPKSLCNDFGLFRCSIATSYIENDDGADYSG